MFPNYEKLDSFKTFFIECNFKCCSRKAYRFVQPLKEEGG
jgi:hypothetical protein